MLKNFFKISKMQNSLYRITAYAYISSLEVCLKDLIVTYMGNNVLKDETVKIPKDACTKAIQRLVKDIGFEDENLQVLDIINYFDYGDLLQIINSNKSNININVFNYLFKINKDLEKVIPIRNSVMHARPISFSDYHYIFELCSTLTEQENYDVWNQLVLLKNQIDKDENYVFSKYKIPEDSNYKYNHNLPLPDYDETGLIGREKEEEILKKLCYRQNVSVISVIGEGGIGKTALALKVAYDLLDDPNSQFDSVIWVSSKTTKISLSEIQEIKGACSSSLGILNQISKELSGVDTLSLSDAINEVKDYLENFKIALFIDNLETILDENIRELVQSVGVGSKVIFTSRIGLGAYEHPVKLSGIDENNASRFLRTLARIRGVKTLESLPEITLKSYVKRMNYNPSYIKWFVSCVQSGKRAEEILQNSKLFLEFCMSNVYEFLNNDTKELTKIMQCAQGPRELPELQFFSEYDSLKLQTCINQLLSTNMLEQRSKPIMGSSKSTYELSELARKFLSFKYPPTKALRDKVRKNINRLQSNSDDYTQKSMNFYRSHNIKIRDKKDIVVAQQLSTVVSLISQSRFERAQEILDELKALSPDYFEIHRVYAFFYKKQENIQEAISCYELAIELAPNSAIIYFWFGRFLLDEDDSERGLDMLKKAHQLDKNSVDIILTLIRANLYQKNFEDAFSLIDNIDEKILDEYTRKQFFVQKIQYFYRLSDKYWSEKKFKKCLDELNQMRRIFSEVPSADRHHSLISYMGKSKFFLRKIVRLTEDPEVIRQSKEILNWLDFLEK